MAENILYLLNQDKPNAKAVVWAHNTHIARDKLTYYKITMGSQLANVLNEAYYAIGFEFYQGSLRVWDPDNNRYYSSTVGIPPIESLPWYFNNTDLDKLFIDFRNTGADLVKNFSQSYGMHRIGATIIPKQPATTSVSLKNYDGMIFIKETTAAKDFTKVVLE